MLALGINAAFHDSSACLLIDGKIAAAAEEERFLRIKHHKRPRPQHSFALPFHAIAYCLRHAGVTLDDLDAIAYSFEPLAVTRGSLPIVAQLPQTPDDLKAPVAVDRWRANFLVGILDAPELLLEDAPFHLRDVFRAGLDLRERFEWVPHHLAHAASAFYPSPFDRAMVVSLDGYGGDATSSWWVGEDRALNSLGNVQMPHSLGLVYEQVTAWLGFERSSDEYKVMGMAAYGEPRHADRFRSAIRVGELQFEVDRLELESWFGPSRVGELTPLHFDVAASVQRVLEEVVVELVGQLARRTGCAQLCLAGGVALNCVLNSRLRRMDEVEELWIPPVAGDAGTALGAALTVAIAQGDPRCRLHSASLGPSNSDEEIELLLRTAACDYQRPDDLTGEVAELLAQGRVVGWFQGRMEFGARALGARSFLAAPFRAEMTERLNLLKGRELFRPLAPVVPLEKANDWFEDAGPSPFMTLVFEVLASKADTIAAVTHEDRSARVQTVSSENDALLHRLLTDFEELTDCPILVNTSFNVAGQPIVATAREALAIFATTALDVLVLGPFLLKKTKANEAET